MADSRFKGVGEAVQKTQEKVNAAKKAFKAIDWKAKFIFAFQTIVLILLLVLHGYSTFDNFRQVTGVKWACLLTTLIALVTSRFLFRSFGPGPAATVVFSLFIAPITYSAVFLGGPNATGFILAGKDTGFWASLSCLGTIVIMLAWVYQREIPPALKHVIALPIGYCALGFLVGLFRGAPLDLVILGTGFLRAIPFVFQPASLYLNAILPLFLVGIFILGCLNLFTGERERLPALAALGIFFVLPFIMGIATMNRYLIPNLSFALFGKPIGIGAATVKYVSTWETNDTGSKEHEIAIKTKGYKSGMTPNYEIKASVIPPASYDQKTVLKVSIKDVNRKSDVLNLQSEDLIIEENGVGQQHRLISQLDRQALDMMLSTRVVLVLDVSGSMSGAPIEGLRKSATRFVEKLVPGIEVFLISFASKIHLLTDSFSRERTLLVSLIAALKEEGGTRMFDSILEGFTQLEKQSAGRGIVVVFSDGGDNESRTSFSMTLEQIKGKGVQVFTIGLGSGMDASSGSGKILKQIAEITGGKFFHASQIDDLEKIFDQIFEFISCKYELEYQKGLPPPPTIALRAPTPGKELFAPFDVEADASGRIERVEFLLDNVSIKSFLEKREGRFKHAGENPEEQEAGKHQLIARAFDIYGRFAEQKIEVVFKKQLPVVTIAEPPEGKLFWKDGAIKVRVKGQHYRDVSLFLDDTLQKTFPAKGEMYQWPFTVATLKEGLHVIRAEAAMADGRKTGAMSTFKTVIPKPTAGITSPRDGTQVFGLVPLVAQAESGLDEVKLTAVKMLVDGKEVQTFSTKPYRLDWNAEEVPEGPHEIKVVVINEIGLQAERKVGVQVIKPKFSLAFRDLLAGQVLKKNTAAGLTLVNEQPETTIDRIELTIDDNPFKTLKAEPWDFLIDISLLKPGEHELKATALRSDGKTFAIALPFVVQPPRHITVFFSARDDKGRYLSSEALKQLPLEVKEDGKPVTDFSFSSAADLPVNFGMVIDVSGSMAEDHKLDKAKEAASLFIDMMKSNDRAFIIRFSDAPDLMCQLTGDRSRLLQQIEYLVPLKATALYDAVDLAIENSTGSKDRFAFLVLSDGLDQNLNGTAPGSMKTLPEVVEKARRRDVQIFPIGLGRELLKFGSRGEGALKTLSSQTGGSYFFAPSGAQLMEVFRLVIREVGSQSKLEFVPPSGANDGKWHTLEITVPSRKDVNFIYKPTYLAR